MTATSHHNIEPAVRIGKNGLTLGIIDEIRFAFKKAPMIKVRFLPNFPGDKDEATQAIVKETSAKCTHSIGGIIVLERTSKR